MIHRVKQLMQHFDLTTSAFADEIDVQRSGMSHILSGRNRPSLDFVLKVKSRFPEVSLDWLLLGKSQMLVSKSKEKQEPESAEELPGLFQLVKDEEPAVYQSSRPKEKPVAKGETGSDALEYVIMVFEDGSFRNLKPRP